MLKKLSFLLAACLIMMIGCKDPDAAPVIVFTELEVGAFPFLNELKTAEFDLADLAGSAYEMDVYFVDGVGGDNVAQYNVYVAFDDNNPDNGDLSTETTLFKSFSTSDFATLGDKGNLGLTVLIPFSEVAAFVGAGSVGNVISGDRFQFRTEIVTAGGVVFNSVNSTPAVTNAFGGIWNFNVNATCPLSADAFTGAYTCSYGFVYDVFPLFGADVQPFGPAPLVLPVTLSTVAGSTTRRVFNYGPYLLPGYGFGTTDITLEFACDIMTSNNIDSGAGCGAGSIQASQVGVSTFDLNNDSTWTIEYADFEPDGGCGPSQTPNPFSIIFTKM
jgi:hypothetical protein